MRIILDTEKKTITVPWNYQQKLDELNKKLDKVYHNYSSLLVDFFVKKYVITAEVTDENKVNIS